MEWEVRLHSTNMKEENSRVFLVIAFMKIMFYKISCRLNPQVQRVKLIVVKRISTLFFSG